MCVLLFGYVSQARISRGAPAPLTPCCPKSCSLPATQPAAVGYCAPTPHGGCQDLTLPHLGSISAFGYPPHPLLPHLGWHLGRMSGGWAGLSPPHAHIRKLMFCVVALLPGSHFLFYLLFSCLVD